MATPAELQAKIERERLELVALRNKAAALPDGPERDAVQAQRDALRAQQKTTTRELEVATSQSPATGQFEGVDANSGQYRYKNPETGTSFLANTAPTTAQQQSSGQTAPTPAATPLPTEARPETAPAEVQTPAPPPQFVQTIEPAPVVVQPQVAIPLVATDAPAPVNETGDQALLTPEQSLAPGEELVTTDSPAPVNETGDQALLTPEQSIARAQGVRLDVPVDDPAAVAAAANANTSTSVLRAIGVPPPVDPAVDQSAAETDRLARGGADAADAASNESTAETARLNRGAAAAEAAALARAKEQAAIQARLGQSANGDWRVRLRLAPSATYLYKSADSTSILAPLKASDGVIFPYTPSITTSYNANYDTTDLTHSNYRGQFYKSSNTGDISLNGIFTAQDTTEAAYMLAVIHFFRSVTKMFYGQDAERGAPPPLVYLSGFGPYQFNGHPCVVKTFNYTMPNDVDYVRIQPNNYGQNLLNRRVPIAAAAASNTISSVLGRLGNAVDLLGNLLKKGALPGGAGAKPGGQPGVVQQAVYNTSNATYVPTKIEIQLTLLPIQTRNQVSQQFSLKDYANGSLLRGGFW